MHILRSYPHNISMKKNYILCGLAGWCMEVLWTGIGSIVSRDLKLTCQTSLWMFPIYGCAAFLIPIMHKIRGKNIFIRGGIYTLCIYAAEYTFGFILTKYHCCPWDYSNQPGNIHGLINLCYAPLWFLVGLFFESILLRPTDSHDAFSRYENLINPHL